METIGSPLLWGGFAAMVVVALLVDLVLMRSGGPHKVTFKEAAYWSLGWVALALLFNAGLWWYLTDLDLKVAKGLLAKPTYQDPGLDVLIERGRQHEQGYLAVSYTHLDVYKRQPSKSVKTLSRRRLLPRSSSGDAATA